MAKPKPKFKLGDKVKDKDGSREGEVSFVGQYDEYINQYRYKVKEKSGKRHTWNEGSMIKAEKSNPAVVTDLKTMGILPPAESPGNYPEIGKDPTWEKLYEHPTVEAKRDTIATLIKAKRPDLANVVAKIPVKGNPTEVVGFDADMKVVFSEIKRNMTNAKTAYNKNNVESLAYHFAELAHSSIFGAMSSGPDKKIWRELQGLKIQIGNLIQKLDSARR